MLRVHHRPPSTHKMTTSLEHISCGCICCTLVSCLSVPQLPVVPNVATVGHSIGIPLAPTCLLYTPDSYSVTPDKSRLTADSGRAVLFFPFPLAALITRPPLPRPSSIDSVRIVAIGYNAKATEGHKAAKEILHCVHGQTDDFRKHSSPCPHLSEDTPRPLCGPRS